jgi:hypothetical protein
VRVVNRWISFAEAEAFAESTKQLKEDELQKMRDAYPDADWDRLLAPPVETDKEGLTDAQVDEVFDEVKASFREAIERSKKDGRGF